MSRISPAPRALPVPAPRVLPPAGPDLLGLRVPDRPGRRPRPGLPEPAARERPGRPGRATPPRRRSRRPSATTTPRARRREAARACSCGSSPADEATAAAPRRARRRWSSMPDVSGPLDLPLRPDPARGRRRPGGGRRHPPGRLRAGRTRSRPRTSSVHRAGLTLHRLPDPRPDRPEHDGRRALGDRLPAGELPDRQAAEVLRRHADAPARLPAGPARGPADVPDPRPGRAPAARARWSSGCRSGGACCWSSWSTCVGALAFAGIGLLIASRAQTTETVSGLMNLVMLPMWLFSGVFFSSERFPDAVQPFIQALPLTQLLNALRAVILEGAGWLDVVPRPGHPRRLGRRHLPARPAALPLDLTAAAGRTSGAGRPRARSAQSTRGDRRRRSGGTSTSSIRWPRKVALARISTSRNAEADWSGIAASFSRRWSRQGEWTSSTGTAKTSRQGSRPSHRPSRPTGPAGRRPTTWSQWSIASRSGSRWAAVQGSSAVVTRTSGAVGPGQAPLERRGPAPLARPRRRPRLGRPAPRRRAGRQRSRRPPRRGRGRPVGEHDDPDAGVGQRVAAEVGVERVDRTRRRAWTSGLRAGRPDSVTARLRPAAAASQRSTAAR